MGWIANVLLLIGAYLIAKRRRVGFVWNLCGTGLWVLVAIESGMWDLVFIEAVFCGVAAWSFCEWGVHECVSNGQSGVRETTGGLGLGPRGKDSPVQGRGFPCNPPARDVHQVWGQNWPSDPAFWYAEPDPMHEQRNV